MVALSAYMTVAEIAPGVMHSMQLNDFPKLLAVHCMSPCRACAHHMTSGSASGVHRSQCT
jgi:hypothetical protein